ncbi:MAG TPA: hypothetical protein V6C85_18075 [Allocoleopsis sp.]
MSQDASTNRRVIEPLTAPPPIQPWSAESEADKLMDELFSDLDRMLEGSNKLPTEPVKPEYISLQSILLPQVAPPAANPLDELQELPDSEPSNASLVEQSQTPATDVVHATSAPPKPRGWWFEKYLLVAGVVSVVIAGILALTLREKLTWPWLPNQEASPSPEISQLSESDTQFVAYALRSLDVIDKKTKKQSATLPGTPSNTTLPPVALNRSPVPNQAPTVLERVYIPVPMPQASSAPSASSQPARPAAPLPTARFSFPSPLPTVRFSLPSPLPTIKLPAPLTSRAAKPSTSSSSQAAKRSAPSPSPAARRSAPSPSTAAKRPASTPSPTVRRLTPPSSQAVAPAAIPNVPAVPSRSGSPNSPVAQAPAPTTGYTLVGLLESGENSAALFDVEGVTQRFKIGEAIGASGWTLVSVANQEAVVRRNGEVRSVYVGQKF